MTNLRVEKKKKGFLEPISITIIIALIALVASIFKFPMFGKIFLLGVLGFTLVGALYYGIRMCVGELIYHEDD